MRRDYTYHRNRARTAKRAGEQRPDLASKALSMKKKYHKAIRKQKRMHWQDFLDEASNIWQAARYLKPSGGSAFARIPCITTLSGSTGENDEIATQLIKDFFPPLPP